jgi:penicillin amidase
MNSSIGPLPPLGKILSPSHGFWKNAEPVDMSYALDIKSDMLQDKVEVYLDERVVPHIFAQNDHDVAFVQGYLHARFRLWQMEFQTHAAAGRLCEIFGEKVGENSVLELRDRKFRRMGMVYGAEQALTKMKDDPEVEAAMNAYTAGVNAYLEQLSADNYPVEYKLLNYAPEKWTNLKTALFLKYMSYDLAADLDDFETTNLFQQVGAANYKLMFPVNHDSLDPILPKGTPFALSSTPPVAATTLDSMHTPAAGSVAYQLEKPDPDNGSNNWVVAGSKTQSGRPILCNDPHLGLNLPSLWFEMQVHTPSYNAYGVSFPGTPAVIIGFNDSISWGVTNAMRDVMDFYEVQFKDSTMNEYLYNGVWEKTKWRQETIRIRGKADYVDKIAMTHWGPVMFDATYGSTASDGRAYAIRWKAHDPSNELHTFYRLNRAKNYSDYLDAISTFSCPGQNFIFASKSNDIAWWQQADFPAKWRYQGDLLMNGTDSTNKWLFQIPQPDNIHMLNPEQGFVATANQLPADTLYPFYLGGRHDMYRGVIINRKLRAMNGITPMDMQAMQTDNYNVFAEMARPLLLNYVQEEKLESYAKLLLDDVRRWNLRADPDEKGQTIFTGWWRALSDTIWKDNLVRPDKKPVVWPQDPTLLEALLRDSAFYAVDNIATPQKETLLEMVTASLNHTAEKLKTVPNLAWGAYKATRVNHLLKTITPFSRLNLNVGGGDKIINATKEDHGPSWRMIVHMTNETEAYIVYPGGQSGNPGSKYYDTFVESWAKGQYYKAWLMKSGDGQSDKVKWKMTFSKS